MVAGVTLVTPAGEDLAVGRAGWWYVGGVGVGSGLMVAAAINQPYNQNELQHVCQCRSRRCQADP
jgi:hypothetical protein